MEGPFQNLSRAAAPGESIKLLRPRFAIQIETNLQLIPVHLKYAIIPFPSLRPRDELDVNFMWSGLNIDVENALVVGFRRFGAETVSVNEDPRRAEPGCRDD